MKYKSHIRALCFSVIVDDKTKEYPDQWPWGEKLDCETEACQKHWPIMQAWWSLCDVVCCKQCHCVLCIWTNRFPIWIVCWLIFCVLCNMEISSTCSPTLSLFLSTAWSAINFFANDRSAGVTHRAAAINTCVLFLHQFMSGSEATMRFSILTCFLFLFVSELLASEKK